nr:hypothetical protein [Myxococcota bacterium]
METEWRLFVDESGDAEDPEDDFIVASLLVRSEDSLAAAPVLRQALSEHASGLPWPLHAWVWKMEAAAAVAHWAHWEGVSREIVARAGGPLTRIVERLTTHAMPDDADWTRLALQLQRHGIEGAAQDWALRHLEQLRPVLSGTARPLRWALLGRALLRDMFPEADAVLRHMEAGAPEALERVRENLSENRDPRWEDLQEIHRAFHQAPQEVRKPFQRQVGRLRAAFRTCLGLLGDPSREERAYAVLAAESLAGDWRPPDGGDRYRSLLVALMERVVACLERLPGTHRVWLHVLTRHVEDGRLGIPVPLHIEHLHDLVHRLHQTRAPSTVRLVPAETPRWKDGIDPIYCLADF